MTANVFPVNTTAVNGVTQGGAAVVIPSILAQYCSGPARRHKRLVRKAGRLCQLIDLNGNIYNVYVAINKQTIIKTEGVMSYRYRMGYVSICDLYDQGFNQLVEEGFVVETPEVTYHVKDAELETVGNHIVRFAMELIG